MYFILQRVDVGCRLTVEKGAQLATFNLPKGSGKREADSDKFIKLKFLLPKCKVIPREIDILNDVVCHTIPKASREKYKI